MEKFPDLIPLRFPFVSSRYGHLVIFFFFVLVFFRTQSGILPKRAVAAIEGTIKPAEIRSNFRHGSKGTLQLEYQKI